MPQAADIWDLTWGRPSIDPLALAEAIERQASADPLDFRTRLLIRDALHGLRGHWGGQRFADWLAASPRSQSLQRILDSDLGSSGFPTLAQRLMEPTRPDTVKTFLRDLGSRLNGDADVSVGGSIALILQSGLVRATDDIDVVDELPAAVRAEHQLLDDLARRYGLRLTHFQSHFLPSGWQARLHSLGPFGRLRVFLVDAYDVCLSKLFSGREKDLDDLRVLLTRLDRAALTRRLLDDASRHLADETLRQNAARNWYVLFGQPLPYTPPPEPIK